MACAVVFAPTSSNLLQWLAMKTTVKNISDTRVLVSVTLDAEALEAAEQVALKKLSKDVKVNGFRKGGIYVQALGQIVDSCRCFYPFGHHAEAGGDLLKLFSPAQPQANLPVAREVASAGKGQIA